jgi:hypothetical protein
LKEQHLSDQNIPVLMERLLASADEVASFPHPSHCDHLHSATDVMRDASAELGRQSAEIERLSALVNTPQLHDFSAAVVLEAAHQRERWSADHDAGKEPEDWFWLLGYLAGKALASAKAGDRDKAMHHTISSAAALANWHAALLGADTRMRPGIDPAARGVQGG